MKSYIEILSNIYYSGTTKYPTRVDGNIGDVNGKTRTIGLPCVSFFHNLKDGFPLLTTKKMSMKSISIELEGFIKGITSKKWYQDRGCTIWDEWANPVAVQREIDYLNQGGGDISWATKEIQKQQDDLGAFYAHQWRRFGECIDEDDDSSRKGTDQLYEIVRKLHNYPYDRRMICSAWNPNQLSRQALPSCHCLWGVTVYNNALHMQVFFRSWDYFLGAPYNIASYALLLMLLSKESGLNPGILKIDGLDTHLYHNQLDAVSIQLGRSILKLPTLKLKNNSKFDIFEWTHEDFILENYNSHGKLSATVVV